MATRLKKLGLTRQANKFDFLNLYGMHMICPLRVIIKLKAIDYFIDEDNT